MPHKAQQTATITGRQSGLFDWFRDLSTTERRTLWACFGGWAVDAFDVQVYSFTIATLIGLWHITGAQAGELGTVTLLLSSLGGWLSGMLSDRYGRVRILQLTIAVFAIFTFLSGFAQNFTQLFICRAFQGLGFGGEWAAGAVLMGEIIRSEYRGRAVGTVQSGFAIGWGAAAILYTILFSIVPAENAWRVLFWIGLAPAALVFAVRRFVPEPAIARHKVRDGGIFGTLFAIFTPDYLGTTIKAALLTTGAQGGYYAVAIWLPTYLKTTRDLSVFNTGAYLFVVIAGAFVGFLVAAYLADYIGRRRTFFLFAVCAAIMTVVYLFLPISNGAMLILGFPLGVFANGVYSPLGPFLSELYPTRIRATAQGFAYNAGRAIGAFFPMLVGFLSGSIPLGQAIGTFTLISYGILMTACLMLPETKGRELLD
jgi:MFS family permease